MSARLPVVAASGAHVIQDGLVALQYVIFPALAQALGLSYAQIGLLRAISNTTMTAFEIPAAMLAERHGERRLLVFGLVCAALGYIAVALAPDFIFAAIGFLIAGTGGAFQHSLSSSLLARSYDTSIRRQMLGTYNAAGDAGKLAYTGTFSIAVGAGLSWNWIVIALATLAIAFSFLLTGWITAARTLDVPIQPRDRQDANTATRTWGIVFPKKFAALAWIVFLDSIVQAVFLTFLAFVMIDKGLGSVLAGFAVVIALIGGMAGKYAAAKLAVSLGDRTAFIVLQSGTIVLVSAIILLDAWPAMMLLPFAGVVVQGSSTICYGAVPDLVADGRQSRGYSLIYTAANAASIVGPLGFGLLADKTGATQALWIAVVVTLLTLPFALSLSSRDKSRTQTGNA